MPSRRECGLGMCLGTSLILRRSEQSRAGIPQFCTRIHRPTGRAAPCEGGRVMAEYWYNLYTKQVEEGPKDDYRQLMGPLGLAVATSSEPMP